MVSLGQILVPKNSEKNINFVTKEKTNKFMQLVLSLGTLKIIVGPSSMQWRPPRNMFKSNDEIKTQVHVPVFLIM